MTHVLAIASQKGGVAKTTSVHNLSAALARRGARVLAIDIDPQGNLTSSLGVDADEGNTIYDVLKQPTRGVEFATVHTLAGVDLVPANLTLALAEVELNGAMSRETLLRKALKPALGHYDLIIVDCPPSLGLFTLNALAAATEVIVPLQAQVHAWRALPQLEEVIALVREEFNGRLEIGGIFLTMYDRTMLATEIKNNALAQYGDKVFQTAIPRNIKVAESPAANQTIWEYDPASAGAKAYEALAGEMEERYGWQK